jgi:hypothetical protein
VVERLQVAAAEGRLTAEELEERVEAALSARTVGEIAVLTGDLPSEAGSAGSGGARSRIQQRGGGIERSGPWIVPPRMELKPAWCNVTLDFTQATVTHPTLHIDLDMRGGMLMLVAGPGVVVDLDQVTLNFAKIKQRGPRAGDASEPLLRVEVAGQMHFGKILVRSPRRAFRM